MADVPNRSSRCRPGRCVGWSESTIAGRLGFDPTASDVHVARERLNITRYDDGRPDPVVPAQGAFAMVRWPVSGIL
jgi:hypothetical protein